MLGLSDTAPTSPPNREVASGVILRGSGVTLRGSGVILRGSGVISRGSGGLSTAICFVAGLGASSVETVLGLSGKVDVDSASVSLLILLLDTTDSPLGSLRKPMRPSFSMATKLVRTLDRGLGDPLAPV